MKVVIPNYAAPDSFVDNVAHCLKDLGHEVLTMPPRSNRWHNTPLLRLWRETRSKLWPKSSSPNERWLLQNVKTWRPDILLCLTQALSEEALAEVRAAGVRHRVAWWGDTPANMAKMGLLSPEWDRIYLKDPHGVAKFRRLGLDASLLHEAMNPHWHRPVATRRNHEVAIAGSFYGYRQALTSTLLKNNVEVGLYGGRLPLWIRDDIRARHTGEFIVREEKSRVFGEALACLNSTSLSEGNSLNCRAFEIAGAGGFQLLENREIVSECFEPGKELVVFDSVEELLELIERAGRDEAWASRIREAGARRALHEHTYGHRLKRIFSDLD